MNTKHRKPVILDDLIPLSISFINKSFDLKWVGKSNREINLYSTNPVTGAKEIVACISITLNIDTDGNDYADLQYTFNGKAVAQRIELLVKRDNLNKGNLFYFRCPVTSNQKRKLFLYAGRFVSKQAIEGRSYYKSELQSRKQRNGMKDLKKLIKLQDTVKQAKKKYFTKYYAGEPTKQYIKVLMAADDLSASW